jgi:hypothetical protein
MIKNKSLLTIIIPVSGTNPIMCHETQANIWVQISDTCDAFLKREHIYCDHEELAKLWSMEIFCMQCGLIFEIQATNSRRFYVPKMMPVVSNPLEERAQEIKYGYGFVPIHLIDYLFLELCSVASIINY